MRPSVPIVLSVAVVLCGVVVWRVVHSHSTTPVREAGPHRQDDDVAPLSPTVGEQSTDGKADGSEAEIAGMDRADYDVVVRSTWRLLKRGDVGQLVQELVEGKSIDDIIDQNLRSFVSATLKDTDDEYATAKLATSASEERVIQKNIDAGMYGTDSRPMNYEPGKKQLISIGRRLPDKTWIYVRIFEGDEPEFEESRREFQSIRDRRVNEVTQLFNEHGLVTTWASK